MKKVLLLAVLGMIFLAKTSVGAEMRSSCVAPASVWIKLNIILHRPKLNCERGFGVCFLFTWGLEQAGGFAEKTFCPVRGMLNEKNQLILEFEEGALTKYEGGSALSNFKDKTSITILDPYTVPESTCRALGSASSITIKPGTYPVLYQNKVYTIVFQL